MDLLEEGTNEILLENMESTMTPTNVNETLCNNEVSTPLNKEISNENKIKYLHESKIKIVKEKLIKSFINKNKKMSMITNIDFNSADDMILKFKSIENNILILRKREISHYFNLGEIIYNMKIMFPVNWYDILKKNKISYSLQYFNFLIKLYNLFHKYKKLHNSTLNVTYFRKNLNIITYIVNNDF